jgi:hypothetical protein
MQQAVGPQAVSFFGGIPDNTRFALAALAADYELKRYGLGLARTTLSDLGNMVDSSRAAVSMIWFELAYDPITVSTNKDAFGLKGPRLQVKAGSFDWDPKGATPKAFDFAKKMTQRVETLAATQPLLADLQNLADLSIVAALITRDRLARQAGWDATWALEGFPIATLPTPKTAEALVNYTNGSLACGGVMINPMTFVAAPPKDDADNQLGSVRRNYERKRAEQPDGIAVGIDPAPKAP